MTTPTLVPTLTPIHTPKQKLKNTRQHPIIGHCPHLSSEATSTPISPTSAPAPTPTPRKAPKKKYKQTARKDNAVPLSGITTTSVSTSSPTSSRMSTSQQVPTSSKRTIPTNIQTTTSSATLSTSTSKSTSTLTIADLSTWVNKFQTLTGTTDKKHFLRETGRPYLPLLHLIYSPYISFGVTASNVKRAVERSQSRMMPTDPTSSKMRKSRHRQKKTQDEVKIIPPVDIPSETLLSVDYLMFVLRRCASRDLSGDNAVKALAEIVVQVQSQPVHESIRPQDDGCTDPYLLVPTSPRSTNDVQSAGKRPKGEDKKMHEVIPSLTVPTMPVPDNATQSAVIYDVINRSLRVGVAAKTINAAFGNVNIVTTGAKLDSYSTDLQIQSQIRPQTCEWQLPSGETIENRKDRSTTVCGNTNSAVNDDISLRNRGSLSQIYTSTYDLSQTKTDIYNSYTHESTEFVIPSFRVALAAVGDVNMIELEMPTVSDTATTLANSTLNNSQTLTYGANPTWYLSRKFDGVRCVCVCIPRVDQQSLRLDWNSLFGHGTTISDSFKSSTVISTITSISSNNIEKDTLCMHGCGHGHQERNNAKNDDISDDVSVLFFTRAGHQIHTLSHLTAPVKETYRALTKHTQSKVTMVLDGEIAVHNDPIVDGPSGIHSSHEVCTHACTNPHVNHRDDFSKVMRYIRRKNGAMPKPVFWVFDMLSAEEFVSGKGTRPFSERVRVMRHVREWMLYSKRSIGNLKPPFEHVPVGTTASVRTSEDEGERMTPQPIRSVGNKQNNNVSGRESVDDVVSDDVYKGGSVHIVEQIDVHDMQTINRMVDTAAKYRWEGVMLRRASSVYNGKRTKDLLKLKPWFDAEFVVTSVKVGKMRRSISRQREIETERMKLRNSVSSGRSCAISSTNVETFSSLSSGNGTDTGDSLRVDRSTSTCGDKDEVVVTRLNVLHKGAEVGVGSGMNMEQRVRWARDPSEIVGREITVKYSSESVNSKTKKLSLRHPTLVHVHGPEGRTT
eukprot:CFRG2210T1